MEILSPLSLSLTLFDFLIDRTQRHYKNRTPLGETIMAAF
jgi:hypothetical protein